MTDEPWDLPLLEFASKATKDLRKLVAKNRADAKSIKAALEELRTGTGTLDITPLKDKPPWKRLRVGDWRVIYRHMTPDEVTDVCRRRLPALAEQLGAEPELPTAGTGFLVARVVNRRELERAVAAL